MGSQVDVRSMEALKEFRVALALYGEDALAALGAVDAEVKRALIWLQDDRPAFWQDQIKRRRERVASAKAEVFRRKLQKTPDNSPSMAEPLELLRRAQASLEDAERRLIAVRKWRPILNQAALEYRASTRRLKTLASTEIPRGAGLLGRLIESLEAYLAAAPPSSASRETSSGVASPFESMANAALDQEPEPAPDEPEEQADPSEGQEQADAEP